METLGDIEIEAEDDKLSEELADSLNELVLVIEAVSDRLEDSDFELVADEVPVLEIEAEFEMELEMEIEELSVLVLDAELLCVREIVAV